MEKIFDKIREAGLRLTQPRKDLVAILANAERPLSAEDILDSAPPGALDLVTIYRNLSTLCELELALAIPLENGKSIYELSDDSHGHHHHHHHVVCRKCHNAVCIDMCFAQELEKHASKLGFSELTHTVEVYGLCEECSKTSSASQ